MSRHDARTDFLQQITLVMGNRNQLAWDLPAVNSFELQRAIYAIPQADFRRTRDDFIELLELKDLVNKPVRNLSLGERMKVEIVGSLLHRPRVLYLDEPTIGLDVTMQRRIRTFIAEYNQRHGATVLLTSHYMADVEALCKRVIVIHHGRLLFDGDLTGLVERFSAFKTIGVTLENGGADLSGYGDVLEQQGSLVKLRVPKAQTPQVTARLLAELQVDDLTVEDPPIEDVIEQVFSLKAPEVRRNEAAAGLLLDLDEERHPDPVPIPGGELLLHDRHDRRAGDLPGGVVDGGTGAGRRSERLHTGGFRRLLHRVDAGAQYEHRLHTLRLGVAHPARPVVG